MDYWLEDREVVEGEEVPWQDPLQLSVFCMISNRRHHLRLDRGISDDYSWDREANCLADINLEAV